MTPSDFESLVFSIGFSPVPEKFRSMIANVAITIENEPDEATRKNMKLPEDETLLGLYHGLPLAARGEGYGYGNMPDKITLYRLPIIRAAEEDGLPVKQVIEETIWHEVAHHFGLDEEEVERREGKRFDR
jgi:predicted Zn-dependent protease with MMP-like domain